MKENNNPNNSVYSSAQKASLRERLGEASSPLLRGGDGGRLLTIIIPTYNMEKYLRHCLDSLIVPNMDKVEVLVINDGSKDSSSAIAHEYQDKYPQTFRVIDKENGNYGSCINCGLKEATGKYVKILDADDSFDSKALDTYIVELSNIEVDLILTDYVIVDENDEVKEVRKLAESYSDIPVNGVFDIAMLSRGKEKFIGQMHAFTYETSILRKMGYHQTEGISYTDQEWVFMPITRVKTCYYLPLLVYRYLVGRQGQTVSNMGKSIKQLIAVIFSMADFYSTINANALPCNDYLLNQLRRQINFVYWFGLYKKLFSLDILQNFDQNLKDYPVLYHIVDDEICERYPLYPKYIRYWRRHQDKELPWPFFIRKIIRALLDKVHKTYASN